MVNFISKPFNKRCNSNSLSRSHVSILPSRVFPKDGMDPIIASPLSNNLDTSYIVRSFGKDPIETE